MARMMQVDAASVAAEMVKSAGAGVQSIIGGSPSPDSVLAVMRHLRPPKNMKEWHLFFLGPAAVVFLANLEQRKMNFKMAREFAHKDFDKALDAMEAAVHKMKKTKAQQAALMLMNTKGRKR